MVKCGAVIERVRRGVLRKATGTFKRQVSQNIPAGRAFLGVGALEISRVVALFESRRAVGARLEGCVASSNETSGVTDACQTETGRKVSHQDTARSLAHVNRREYWFQIE